MTDFHSHILPGIDDGSKNTEESVALLKMLSLQGVSTVIATPHFYPRSENAVSEFISRREMSLSKLASHLTDDMPKILSGAEIEYYQGLSRMSGLARLCIENSNLLLLEMPTSRWTDYTVKELLYLANSGKFKIVIAHVERCLKFQKREVIHILYESGILMQINADFVIRFSTKRKALSMLKNGRATLIGSDCHNLTTRPPHIGAAFKIIEKKLGKEFVEQLELHSRSLLTN